MHAGAIVARLLGLGHTVHGTLRDLSKADALKVSDHDDMTACSRVGTLDALYLGCLVVPMPSEA